MKEDLLEDQYQRTLAVNRRFFDATHHDMTCGRQWHCELFSADWQCLMSDIDL